MEQPQKTEKEIIIESVKDLTRTYKPDPEEVPAFIKRFINKYKIPQAYRKSLEKVAMEVVLRNAEDS